MTTFQERFNLALKKADFTGAQLAEKTKLSAGAISHWRTGRRDIQSYKAASKVAEALNVSADWLMYGRGNPEDSFKPVNSTYTTIPYKRISFQCGEGYEPSYEDLLDETFIKLENKFFVDNQVSPNHCICVKVEGDSMEPLIYNGEYVVIDQNERNIREGKVYAFGVQGKMRIKRLYPKIDGSLVIKSENKNFEDDHVPPELMDSVVIIGRVVARIGTAPFK